MTRPETEPRGTVLVTGANSGVGRAASERLARRGWRVLMLCRDPGRGEVARRAVADAAAGPGPELVVADLERPEQVRSAAATVVERGEPLAAMVANAGVYRAALERSVIGVERTMAVNHLGHFQLVNLLLRPLRAAGGRVIVVSSDAHRAGRLGRRPLEEILRGEGGYSGWQAYADSKLANILFAFELGRRLQDPGVAVVALHPGVLSTRIWNKNRDLSSWLARLAKPFMRRPETGGARVARLVLDPELAGARELYVKGDEPARAGSAAYDRDLASRLWELSGRLLAEAGYALPGPE